jgi:hypothetical protein
MRSGFPRSRKLLVPVRDPLVENAPDSIRNSGCLLLVWFDNVCSFALVAHRTEGTKIRPLMQKLGIEMFPLDT